MSTTHRKYYVEVFHRIPNIPKNNADISLQIYPPPEENKKQQQMNHDIILQFLL